MNIYRYTTNGEGVWSAGKRLLPLELVDEVNENRKWLIKPNLPEGKFRFWLTEEGKEKYLSTLYATHIKYLENIELHMDSLENLNKDKIVYQDDYQIVEELD